MAQVAPSIQPSCHLYTCCDVFGAMLPSVDGNEQSHVDVNDHDRSVAKPLGDNLALKAEKQVSIGERRRTVYAGSRRKLWDWNPPSLHLDSWEITDMAAGVAEVEGKGLELADTVSKEPRGALGTVRWSCGALRRFTGGCLYV